MHYRFAAHVKTKEKATGKLFFKADKGRKVRESEKSKCKISISSDHPTHTLHPASSFFKCFAMIASTQIENNTFPRATLPTFFLNYIAPPASVNECNAFLQPLHITLF